MKFRLDFPPEVTERRDRLFKTIHRLLVENTLLSVEKAVDLHRTWLQDFPNDYLALDAGELLILSRDVLLTSEPQLALASSLLIRACQAARR